MLTDQTVLYNKNWRIPNSLFSALLQRLEYLEGRKQAGFSFPLPYSSYCLQIVLPWKFSNVVQKLEMLIRNKRKMDA